jgi:hypothetical protein
VLGENLLRGHFLPSQIPHDLTWDLTCSAVVGGRLVKIIKSVQIS